MITFLLVFTGLEPAANSSDFFVDGMPCTIIWYARLVLCGLEEDWEQTRPTDARGRSLEILLAWA